MNVLKSFLVLFFVSKAIFSFSQNEWKPQSPGTTEHLYSVWFSDRYHGWAVGDNGAIIQTKNSGQKWSSQSSGISTPLNSVCFATNYSGWAVGISGKIIHTANGGSTWNVQTSNTTENLNGVYFTDSLTGWAVGTGGALLYTSDGGSNWAKQSSAVIPTSNAVKFVSKKKGWAVGNMGRIIYTIDAGTNWNTQTSGTSFPLYGVHFPDSLHGWAVGTNGVILKTSNGGLKWSAQNSTTTEALLSVYFTDTLKGWAVGTTGCILNTSDGGNTWNKTIISGLTSNLRSVYFYKNNPGWIVGNDAKIYYKRASEEICMVTVDTNSNKNMIIWERRGWQNTDHYNVYKLVSTTYNLIGSVPFSDLPVFTDPSSRPHNSSERYRITTVDSLGNESEPSPYHETILLLASKGVGPNDVNLSWNKYIDESGAFIPEKYYIYRGTKPNKLHLADSVPGAGVTAMVLNNVFGTEYFRIVFNKPELCSPLTILRGNTKGGPYSQSYSNLKDYSLTGIDYLEGITSSLSISKEAQVFSLDIMTNLTNWNVVSDQSWLFVIKDIANKTITATTAENTDLNPRTAILTLSGIGVTDKFIILTQDGTSTGIQEYGKDDELKVLYNPADKTIRVFFSDDDSALYKTIEIFDIQGRIVLNSKTNSSFPELINVSRLKSGIYIIKVCGNKYHTLKMMIE